MLFGESECKRCCTLYGKSLCKLLGSQICMQKFTVDAQSVRGCLAGDSKSAAIRKKVGRCFGTGTEYQSPLPLPLKITTCTASEWPVPVGPLTEAMP